MQGKKQRRDGDSNRKLKGKTSLYTEYDNTWNIATGHGHRAANLRLFLGGGDGGGFES